MRLTAAADLGLVAAAYIGEPSQSGPAWRTAGWSSGTIVRIAPWITWSGLS